MTAQLALTEDERHAAFLHAQARAFECADNADYRDGLGQVARGATSDALRSKAQTWAAVATALRKDHA